MGVDCVLEQTGSQTCPHGPAMEDAGGPRCVPSNMRMLCVCVTGCWKQPRKSCVCASDAKGYLDQEMSIFLFFKISQRRDMA
jgi:hypothetical protein